MARLPTKRRTQSQNRKLMSPANSSINCGFWDSGLTPNKSSSHSRAISPGVKKVSNLFMLISAFSIEKLVLKRLFGACIQEVAELTTPDELPISVFYDEEQFAWVEFQIETSRKFGAHQI